MWSIFPDPPDSATMSRGPAETASYPVDFGPILGLGNIKYTLPERGSEGLARAWHMVKTAHPNLGSTMPDFYADPMTIASAFNPEVANEAKVKDFLDRNDPSGRNGYQIKLISLKEACADIKGGDMSAAGGLGGLAPYCDDNSKLYY